MKYLIVLLILSACAKPEQIPAGPTVPPPPTRDGTCKVLKSVWTSLTDSESFDLRTDFTFLFSPFTYIGSNGTTCAQQMKWFMITPEVSGASFEMHLQASPGAPCKDGMFYIRTNCDQIQICNSDFTSCKDYE